MNLTDREACIALNMMDKVGPVSVRALAEKLGSIHAIFAVGEAELEAAACGKVSVCRAIIAQRNKVDWRAECERAAGENVRIITIVDREYPRQLAQIHDPPLALYIRGPLEGRDSNSIAVVGTRRPTHYGREVAERMSSQLARSGYTIVSGLARGIDTYAHRGALQSAGRTIAVLGSGLDEITPVENRDLADNIAMSGAVISEFPFGRRPDKATFPMRNRIVSGLVKGVLVVEAGMRSGAWITVNQALDQGRNVFVVPGRIDSPSSSGCLEMIKQGGQLVTGAEDILDELGSLFAGMGPTAAVAHKDGSSKLDPDENSLMVLLEDGEQGIDALIRSSGLDAARVGSTLMALEMKRLVRVLPGRRVERVVSQTSV